MTKDELIKALQEDDLAGDVPVIFGSSSEGIYMRVEGVRVSTNVMTLPRRIFGKDYSDYKGPFIEILEDKNELEDVDG